MPDDDLEQRALARVGRVLDEKYLLERLLGYGGMAAVYAARHRNGHRSAVKILHAEIARDEVVRGRFLHEGYAANRVEHPGAVQVLDDDVVREGEDKGNAYLVMELLEGESVYSRAKQRGRLSEPEVLAIAEGVLDVLEAAHDRGIVHRDLKPDNLFLVRVQGTIAREEREERVKVLDFGIARIADTARKTNVGQTLGTPSYMSPEQARGDRDLVDGRTDLFALGATMFRLLTGRRIHDGEGATEILVKMATLPAPKVRSLAPTVSPPIAAIIDRALQFERDARYANAAEMRNDVRAARAGSSLRSSVPSDFAPVGSPPGFAAGSEPTNIPAALPRTLVERPRAIDALPPTANHPVPAVAPVASVQQAPKRPPIALFAILGIASVAAVSTLVFLLTRGPSSHDTPRTLDEPAEQPEKKAKPKPVPEPTEERPEEPASVPPPTVKPKPSPKPAVKPSASVSTKSIPKMAPIPTPPK